MSDEMVQYELKEGVAVIRMDDGKANALSHAMLDALASALDKAESDEAGAVLLMGRPGRFSAGFDLSVMRAGDMAEVQKLVTKGAVLGLRLFEFPVPVVFGVSGHALAMGAVLCMAVDVRIGIRGDYKLGLNEVAIGMTLPAFALILADERLSRRHLTRATAHAEVYSPEAAVDVGYLDWVVDEEALEETAFLHAKSMSENLHAKAHHRTKLALRADSAERLRESLEGALSL
ncbi:MAG: crotonase/enoyl-CoA hydratase family protein [Myxococcota bacterium]|nr:crotonase/enoyl-CoA hydratase family protein [Myxococcota bacterium]